MSCSNLTTWVSSKIDSFSLSFLDRSSCHNLCNSSFLKYPYRSSASTPMHCSLRELKERINSVKNTQKITEAMKLVAAARVRRAQEAVINVSLVVITGDRGLCGGFNNAVIRKAESRMAELKENGLDYVVISVGKKGNAYFKRRSDVAVVRSIEGRGFYSVKEAQLIADSVFSLFVSEEVDKVELVYTKFVSLVRSDPVVQTLLPLSMKGEACDVNGKCVDAVEDELFRLTTKDGKLIVERDSVRLDGGGLSPLMRFEQDPAQILDAMMPLYLNSQILRSLQESVASEVAARMSAMTSSTDNAIELNKNLSIAYNRERQAKITSELLEIVAGAEALMQLD
ncbi:ATP synthase gamma chain, chloroplastic-like isoform X2 [Mangifera indica]|uniref:ATP synthase gamma chain, chloroplastic-like isoform X2 n=1 Tax=Mangifera indica TaxID=29780 RepID=UPI001CF97CE0|nr:ATP synthase gamma chain, chloroplastic-like isoform X2 [Mangifera indica]